MAWAETKHINREFRVVTFGGGLNKTAFVVRNILGGQFGLNCYG